MDFLSTILAFFLGAIPFKDLAQKLSIGPQTRRISTGEPGTPRTHVLLDPWLITSVALLDIGKAFLATYFGLYYLESYFSAMLLGLGTILGDSYSPFTKNKNSKGISCIIGAALAFDWNLTLIGLIIYIVILSFVHYRIPAFIMLMGIMTIITIIFNNQPYVIGFVLLAFIITTIRSIDNIRNYFEGKEINIMEEFKRRH